MRWKGAYLGALVGNCLGGTVGSFIGAMLGDYDESVKTAQQQEIDLQRCYKLFFRCLGKLGHEQFARRMCQVWNFGDELCNEVMAEVIAGANSSQPFTALVSNLHSAADNMQDPDFRSNAAKLLCMTIPLDNPLASEWTQVQKAGKILGTSQLIEDFLDSYYIYRYKGGYTESQLQESYSCLNVSPHNSNREIKQAYHRQIRNFPLNEVSGVGISTKFVESAEQYFRKKVNAYKILCKARKIK